MNFLNHVNQQFSISFNEKLCKIEKSQFKSQNFSRNFSLLHYEFLDPGIGKCCLIPEKYKLF